MEPSEEQRCPRNSYARPTFCCFTIGREQDRKGKKVMIRILIFFVEYNIREKENRLFGFF